MKYASIHVLEIFQNHFLLLVKLCSGNYHAAVKDPLAKWSQKAENWKKVMAEPERKTLPSTETEFSIALNF